MNSNIQPKRFLLHDLAVDLDQQTVRRNDKVIELPDLSFRLLAALVRSAPSALDKDELISQVWGDVVVSDETLSQRVRLLRQALDEDAQKPRYIATVRGRGYRLICPVLAAPEQKPVQTFRRGWALLGLSAMLALAAWFFWPQSSSPTSIQSSPQLKAIAVLPFADLSPDQDLGYFADGMQEELLSRLAQLQNLTVASRTSVEQYRNSNKSLPDIAKDLDVNAVIESSVRVASNRVRITVQLIDAGSDSHLWAETYDRELSVGNIFAIQQEVAEHIAQALALEFDENSSSPAMQLPTQSVAAYDRYLLGRHHTFKQTPEDLALAIQYLQQALELDPEFAQAWSTLGWAWSFLGTPYGGQPPREVYPQAKNAVTRSLAINNKLSDAHTLYADILAWYDWDFELAELEYQKTLEISPTNVLGYVLLLSAQLRHDEALGLIERRIAAEPDDPYVRVNAGWAYLRARQFERAIEEAARAPGHTDSATITGFSLLALGKMEQALAVFESDLERQGRNPPQIARLAVAHFKTGDSLAGEALMAELEAKAKQDYVSPHLLAEVYFAAGNADRGFEWINRGIEMRSRGSIFLRCSLGLDDFRSDPRYETALKRVGI